MGSLSADAERFMQWRTIDGVTLDPLGRFNELETLVRGLLAPAMLLDYLRYFVLFEDDGGLVKKIAGYHQFHAVRAAIHQVVAASRPGGSHKGGVVWHTQGSGKSITMTCFAARVMREAAMENPTIVVITDRNDLDGQLFGVFSLAQDLLREQPVQAGTRPELRALLANRPSGGIVFATHPEIHAGGGRGRFPCALRAEQYRGDRRRGPPHPIRLRVPSSRRSRPAGTAANDAQSPAGGGARSRVTGRPFRWAMPSICGTPCPNAHLRGLHRHPGVLRGTRDIPGRVRRLHSRLRHAAGQGGWRHGWPSISSRAWPSSP